MKKILLTTLFIMGLLSGFSQTYILWGFGNFYDVTPGVGFPPPGPTYTLRSGPDGTDGAKDFDVTSASCTLTFDGIVNNLELNNDNGTGELTISNNSTLTVNGNAHLNSGTTLTINSGATLIVSNNITNSGTVIIQDGGNLVQTGSGFASGSYQVSQSGSGSANNYNFWSSPISGANLPSVFSGANECDFYYYNAAGAEFRRLSAYSTCLPAATADGSSSMGNGVGYSIAGGGSRTFTGTVNTGNINNTTISTGWNLVGNPYPSSILGSAFVSANGHTTGTLYFWSDDGTAGAGYNETTDYATWNSGGGTGASGGGASTTPNGSVAVGQGFFVSTSSGTNISFTNAMRSSSDNSQFFKTEEDIQRVWISAMAPENSSQILFAFTENATENEDWSYDSKRFSTGDDFAFGSMLEGETDPYAIQSFSDLDLETRREVPLSIYSTSSGVTSFQLDNTENLDSNVIVYIKDNATGKIQELAKGPFATYLNANQLYDSRFTILFQNKNAPDPLGVDEIKTSYLNLTYKENSLFVNNVIPMKQLDVISITGNVMFSTSLQSTYENSIHLDNFSIGVYIARIQNIDGSTESKKFVIQ